MLRLANTPHLARFIVDCAAASVYLILSDVLTQGESPLK